MFWILDIDTFSIQEQHAFVRMLETGSNHSLKIDENEDQQPDHLDQAEIVEEGWFNAALVT